MARHLLSTVFEPSLVAQRYIAVVRNATLEFGRGRLTASRALSGSLERVAGLVGGCQREQRHGPHRGDRRRRPGIGDIVLTRTRHNEHGRAGVIVGSSGRGSGEPRAAHNEVGGRETPPERRTVTAPAQAGPCRSRSAERARSASCCYLRRRAGAGVTRMMVDRCVHLGATPGSRWIQRSIMMPRRQALAVIWMRCGSR
jgi:hypothetical protein